MTIVNWLIATFLPLTSAGDTSAIYIGLNIEAIPTPIPAANRIITKTDKLPEKAIPKDETAKISAAKDKPGFRPYLSASLPAIKQPAIQPSASDPVKKPSHQAFNINSVRKNGNAPDITAKSNPNKYPPKADIKEIPKM